MALALEAGVELVDNSGYRQGCADSLGLGQADRQVLAHPVEGEAEIELTPGHRHPAVGHLPGAGRALRDGVDHLLDVESGPAGEVDPLGQALDQPGDADLVDHLGALSAARPAQQRHRLGIGGDHGLGPVEVGLIAAAHHGEHAVLGAGLTPGNRRVHEPDAPLGRRGVQLLGQISRSGGVVHQNRPGSHRLQYAPLASGDRADVIVVAHAHEHELGTGCRAGRGGGGRAAMLVHPVLGLRRRAVVDRRAVPCRNQVTGHRVAHDPQPHERAISHLALLQDTNDDVLCARATTVAAL